MSVDEDWIATIASSGILSMSMLHPVEAGGLTWSHHLELPQDLSFTFRDGSYQLKLPFLAAIMQGPNSIRVAVWDAHTGQLKRIINPAEYLSDAWYNGHGFQYGAVRLTRSHVVISLMTCVLVVPLSELEDEEAVKRRFVFPSRSMGMDTPEVMLATAVRIAEDSVEDLSPAIWGIPNSPAVYMDGSAAMTRVNLAPPLVILDTSSTSVVPWSDTMTEARFSFGGQTRSTCLPFTHVSLPSHGLSIRKTLCGGERVRTAVHCCRLRSGTTGSPKLGRNHDEDHPPASSHACHMGARRTADCEGGKGQLVQRRCNILIGWSRAVISI
jgi:hypothetical protein